MILDRIQKIIKAQLNDWRGKVSAPMGTVMSKLQEVDIDALLDRVWKTKSQRNVESTPPEQRLGDFLVSLLLLSAKVMTADGKADKHELSYVRSFLADHFGVDHITEYMFILEKAIAQPYDIQQVCKRTCDNTTYDERMLLLQFLFGIANADFNVSESELAFMHQLSKQLLIEEPDYISIRAMYHGEVDSAYKILEIRPSASDAEVVAAYRKMALKFHPDRVAHMGEAAQAVALDKFNWVQEAFEKIKKERGMR